MIRLESSIQWEKHFLNKITCGDALKQLKQIPDKSIDLVIADPPYFKVANQKWDYLWRTKEEYIEWSLNWIKEISRILRYGGTLYLFGYFRVLSHIIPRLEEIEIELKQQIIINKGMQAVSGRATKKYKIFPNVTEIILMMIRDNKQFLKPFLKNRQKEKGFSAKEINERLGVKSNGGGMWSIYAGKNVCEQFPTKEKWEKLQKVLDFNLEYEKVSQTYNTIMGITNVWDDIDFYKEKKYHPTQKPLKLLRRLIKTSSNKGDIILDPFMGSGATAIASKSLGRQFIGFEISEEYCDIANKRLDSMIINYAEDSGSQKNKGLGKFL
ncbi:MAG: site-specific DNA-methyltransferase [Candidatus Lokiarchaeota archaeon]|nr:site-specific DNA-methyltransferase [Candidatus Lokiarchaeota archaeon]